VTVAQTLADRALYGPALADVDRLRTLTMCNLAAAGGELGSMGKLIESLPLDPGRPSDAAFLYGMRLHARTQDDFFPAGRVHVGAVTLAASLALADSSGSRLVEALGAGYEVLCTVSAAYSARAQASGLRPTGVFGPLGAAASAAVALDLDRDGVANSIAMAATLAGGTNAAWLAGSDEWLLEAGVAARLGVEAALFTRAGVRAAPEAIESAAGWARAFFDDDGARALIERLDAAEAGIGSVAIKRYPVSGIAQVPTHLACEARGRRADGESPRATIRISEEEASYPGSTNSGAFVSRSDALMSVVFCVACGLLDGKVRLERLEHPNDRLALEAASRVELVADPLLGENRAILRVGTNGNETASEATAEELLYPSWAKTSAETEAVAVRSEAPGNFVVAVRDELGQARPDAVELRSLLDGEAMR
jgi:2-methylcitrate dehydratase PrpD